MDLRLAAHRADLARNRFRLVTVAARVDQNGRPALRQQATLLNDAVCSAIPQNQRADALVADRQGIGMSHHPAIDVH